MIIERNLAKYIVFSEDSLSTALHKISLNLSGLVFVLSHNGILEGVLTDGDFRRWLLNTKKMDLTLPVVSAYNTEFIFSYDDIKPEELEKLFSERIQFIPLVDKQNRLIGLAHGKQTGIQIGHFNITQETPSFIIAEIGNNHNGNLDLAYRLIDEAITAGADCAKFQMRDMKSVYIEGTSNSSEDLGAQYTLDLLSRFQLSNQDMFKAFDYCKDRGILPLCTPWDIDSVAVLEEYGMLAYKLASADLTNPDLIEALCKTRKPLICSTGMSTESEIADAVNLLKSKGAQYVLMHCNSTYPAPFKDINLNYIDRLKDLGGGCLVGYSGHERGYAVPVAAVSRGARLIEKHLTLDRSMEGNDHRVSLLPNEFAEMVRSIREVESALGSSSVRKVTQGEMMNREVLGKSLIAALPIMRGEIIAAEHLTVRSPGKGLPPYRKSELIGRVSTRQMAVGDFFFTSDLEINEIKSRKYNFNRIFGIPVRYHDVTSMLSKSNFDLLEFHLSYKDLELDPNDFLDQRGYDLNFAVHSPELFSGDHVMDLCSDNKNYRSHSMQELQKVIHITRRLKKFFPKSVRPCIIINAGGFTLNDFMLKKDRKIKYQLISSALNELDTEGVEIIPQTMPPFPWHFGGQRFHNLFMDAEDIVEFCKANNMRVCLDISHSKLACNYTHKSFSTFIDMVAPFAAHLHIVDASGVDGEGLQIGEGEIDFIDLGRQLKILCPSASFIPEVWQGHKNQGEGFWIALDRLEKLFAFEA